MNAPTSEPGRSRLTLAGWICFGAGLATFWLFGLGLIGLCAAFVIGIVALCQSRRGAVALVASSALTIPICVILFITVMPFLWMGYMRHWQREEMRAFMRPSPTPAAHQ